MRLSPTCDCSHITFINFFPSTWGAVIYPALSHLPQSWPQHTASRRYKANANLLASPQFYQDLCQNLHFLNNRLHLCNVRAGRVFPASVYIAGHQTGNVCDGHSPSAALGVGREGQKLLGQSLAVSSIVTRYPKRTCAYSYITNTCGNSVV